MDNKNQADILKKFMEISSYIPLFIDEPVSVAITNRKQFIFNQACEELPITCDFDQPFPKDSTASIVVKTGEKTVRDVSAKVYGIPFRSYAIPLKGKNGETEGCLLIAKSVQIINNVKSAFGSLSLEVKQVSEATNEISDGIQISSVNNHEVLELMNGLLEETQKMNEILSFINRVSNSTKILGLNAAIEAARVGEAGRGFGVVAKEIERMSSDTTGSAKEIGTMLESIRQSLNHISEKVKLTTDTFTEQAASLEEIAATIEDLDSNMEVIEGYVRQL